MAYMNFSSGTFHCDTEGPLTQVDVQSVWDKLPTTGCAWIEHGHLLVQDRDPEVGGAPSTSARWPTRLPASGRSRATRKLYPSFPS